MPTSLFASRGLTLFVAALLGLEGAALLGLGWRIGRPSFIVMGLVLLLSTGLVLQLWRLHLRRLEEIAAARRDLRQETESLRKLLGR